MADEITRDCLPIPARPYEGTLPLDAKDPEATFPPLEPVGKGAAPAPTVTTVGRPECSRLARGSMATVWSLWIWSGQPARDTTHTGALLGHPASMSRRDSAESCLPAM